MDHHDTNEHTPIDDADLDAVSGGQTAGGGGGGFDFSSADRALEQGNARAEVCSELGQRSHTLPGAGQGPGGTNQIGSEADVAQRLAANCWRTLSGNRGR
jgi:hypothetical protein